MLSDEGGVIQGKPLASNNETEWHFLPSKVWENEQVFILMDSELEDVAGNNFKDLLDHAIATGTNNISHISIPINLNSPIPIKKSEL